MELTTLLSSIMSKPPSVGESAPVIKSFSGTLGQGDSFTLSGSFTANRSGQLLYDDFSGGANGDPINPALWKNFSHPSDFYKYDSSVLFAGRQTARADINVGITIVESIFQLPSKTTELYFEYRNHLNIVTEGDDLDGGRQLKFARGNGSSSYNPSTYPIIGNNFLRNAGETTVFSNVGGEIYYGDGSDSITVSNATYPENWVKHCAYHKLGTNDATQDALQMYKMFGKYATEQNFTKSNVPGGHFGSRDGSEPPESWISTPQFGRNPFGDYLASFILPYFNRTSSKYENNVATVFINDSRERVVFSNSSEWVNVDHEKSMVQPMSSRSVTEISCVVERGNLDFGQDIYAYVFNKNGLWNESGFKVN